MTTNPTPPEAPTPETDGFEHFTIEGVDGYLVRAKDARTLERQRDSLRAELMAWQSGAEDVESMKAEIKSLTAKLDTILYDVNYVGGLQDWQQRYHDVLLKLTDALAEVAKLREIVDELLQDNVFTAKEKARALQPR